MSDPPLREAAAWSLRGALGVGALFLGVIVFQSLLRDGDLGRSWAPVLALTLIGATVGGLVGPLVGAVLARRRTAKQGSAEDSPPEDPAP